MKGDKRKCRRLKILLFILDRCISWVLKGDLYMLMSKHKIFNSIYDQSYLGQVVKG